MEGCCANPCETFAAQLLSREDARARSSIGRAARREANWAGGAAAIRRMIDARCDRVEGDAPPVPRWGWGEAAPYHS
jgi:hypothetical protein